MIFGISGKAGAGKDTLADYLVSQYSFKKVSFATTLKAMLAVAGMPEPADRDLKEQLLPGFDFSWREAAQKLGTEWGRSLDQQIWVKIEMQRLAQSPGRYVFSDVRFENEASAIRAVGSIIHLSGRQTELVGETSAHVSEKGISRDFMRDYIVENIGTIKDLHAKVDTIMGMGLAQENLAATANMPVDYSVEDAVRETFLGAKHER